MARRKPTIVRRRGKARTPSKVKDGYASQLERDRAAYHQARLLAGKILRWRHEPLRFKLADKSCNYTPDFVVLELDLTSTVEEVKGYTFGDIQRSRTAFKVAAKENPEYRFRWVTRPKKSPWLEVQYDTETDTAKTL